MQPDLDDTRLSVPGVAAVAPESDLHDTVWRGDRAGAPRRAAHGAPPALVEPPAPQPRLFPVRHPSFETDLVPEATPVLPGAYRAVLADGTQLPLDTPVYLGRKPSIPRIHSGPPPRLVTLPSPGREMSATHLELKVVGGALVASDMRSTNGTVVHLPGAPPRTLVRGESAVIVAGTRIDLGEGAVLDIVVAHDGTRR